MASSKESSEKVAQKPISVLFVCLGNICRSTMAEAVFRHMTGNLPTDPEMPTSSIIKQNPRIGKIDSAGTGGYHIGADPNPRTQSTLLANGIKTYTHAARKVTKKDFLTYDWILGMDEDNVDDLRQLKRRIITTTADQGLVSRMAKVEMFGRFGGRGLEEVIDPYYGADSGFTIAYEQMVRFSRGFLKEIVELEA